MNTILEVATGLLFVFLLFSLLVSAVNEAIFGHLTHLRSRVLEDSLQSILSNNAKGFSVFSWIARLFKRENLKDVSALFSEKLLEHPLVKGLRVGKRRCPSYLPAETFADGALGILLEDWKGGTAPEIDKATITHLGNAIKNLEDETAKKILSGILAGSQDLREARSRLETWFNNSMDRVSGAYKRYTQFWLYVWATAIVLWLNVDTLEIARRLLTDAQFRSVMAAEAANFVAEHNSTRGTNTPQSSVPASGILETNTPPGQSNSNALAMSSRQLLDEIDQLNLPIGWGACTNKPVEGSWIGCVITKLPRLELSAGMSDTNSAAHSLATGILASGAPCPTTPAAWRFKLLGLIITIAAISQGAPFWFDLLNRVTNLRAAGRPPESKKSTG